MANLRAVPELRQWRKGKKLTLQEAAAGVGTTRQVWFDWEKGRSRPGQRYMGRLREFTGGQITADVFFPSCDDAEATRQAA